MSNLHQTPAGQGPDLHDIVLPVEPGLWPLAIGWWLLLAIGVITILFAITLTVKYFKYWEIKRLALSKLSQCKSPNDINQLLKQVAIHYCTRQDIGPMRDEQWTRFLMKNLPEGQQVSLANIHQALYRPNHDEFHRDYLHIASTWLSQLNKSSLQEMNNAVI